MNGNFTIDFFAKIYYYPKSTKDSSSKQITQGGMTMLYYYIVTITNNREFLIKGMSTGRNSLEISEQEFSPNTIKIFNDKDLDTTRIKLSNWLSDHFRLNLISTELVWETRHTSMEPGTYQVPRHKLILASKTPLPIKAIANWK